MTALPDSTDVVIVGAGPAGLAAAERLARAGIATLVLEREGEPGGIPRHCAHSPFGMREYRRVLDGRTYARRLAGVATAAGARIETRTTVTALHPCGVLDVTGPDGLHRIAARAVILATGAREESRAARMIGGTKPGGVLTTGALQTMVQHGAPPAFACPLVVGSELVAFSALLTCRSLGLSPAAMITGGARVTARWPAALLPRVLGVPLLRNTTLDAIHGTTQVTGVTLRGAGGQTRLDCDGVILTGDFRPENALLRACHLELDPGTRGPEVDQYARLSDPAYFACGNLLRGIETAGWCWAEGRAVAGAVLLALDGRLPDPATARLARPAPPIRYVVPQRLAAATAPAALDRLQLRVASDHRGPVGLAGRTHRLSARPERRITLPLPLPASTGTPE